MSTKSIIITILSVAAGLAAVTTAVVLWQQSKANTTSSTTALVIIESGVVRYKSPDSQDYVVINTEEFAIPSGSSLSTDADSYARVFFPDNSLLSIDQNTQVQITFADNNIDIQQLLGQTWHRVQSVTSGGNYQVSTPNAIAAVRGTNFSVAYDGTDITDVEVNEGEVEVTGLIDDSETEDGRFIDRQKMVPGEWIRITGKKRANIKIEKRQIDPERAVTLWFIRNQRLDRDLLEVQESGLTGNNLRDTLNTRIKDTQEAEDLKLDFSGIDPSGAKEDLKDVFDLLKINQDTCEQYSQEQIQNAILKVRRYSRFIQNAEGLESILRGLFNSCEDGKFTVDEAEQMEELIIKFGESSSRNG